MILLLQDAEVAGRSRKTIRTHWYSNIIVILFILSLMSFYFASSNDREKKIIVQEKQTSYWPSSIFYAEEKEIVPEKKTSYWSAGIFLFGLCVYGLPSDPTETEKYLVPCFLLSIIGIACCPWELQYLPIILSFVNVNVACEVRYQPGLTLTYLAVLAGVLALIILVIAGAFKLTFQVLIYV